MSSPATSAPSRRTSPTPTQPRDGWGWLVVSALSRGYLVCVASLAAIALLPGLAGWTATVVQSGSMEPHISAGDVVLTSALPDDAPVPLGRVVTFRTDPASESDGRARTRLHRIVAPNGDGTFVTAGDANADADSVALRPEQITGQARLLVPFVGLPSLWMGAGNAAALVAWLGITVVAIVVLGAGFDRRRNDDENTEPPGTADRAPEVAPADRPADEQIDAGATDGIPDPAPEGPATTGTVSRRIALGLGGAAVASLLGLPREPVSAAFAARTSMAGNSWTVAVPPPLTLGRASTYAVFAASSIANTDAQGNDTSTVDSSVATSPGTTVSNFRPKDITGNIDRNNTAARNARTDLLALNTAIESRGITAVRAPALSGTIRPGVYSSSTGAFTLPTTVTLDAVSDPSAIFIFTANTLSTAENSRVLLVNGASARNVYWRLSATVTLGAGSTAHGTYLAGTNAVLQNASRLTGRLVALNGSVTLTRATVLHP